MGKGVWAALWFVSGVVEVVFSPGSAIAWVFLVVSTVYMFLKMFENLLSENVGLLLGGLTAALWILSFFMI